MRNIFLLCAMALGAITLSAQDIKLVAPSTEGGLSVMATFWNRHSERKISDKMLSDQDLSDLLFAASGINRPESGNITAPTAMNRQEIDLYVFMPSGVYQYRKENHTLVKVADGDQRALVAGFQDFVKTVPVTCLLVINYEKFGRSDEGAVKMAYADAGIMSENIAIMCAGRGLVTVPRATMDSKGISTLLKLSDKQVPALNLPVGYGK